MNVKRNVVLKFATSHARTLTLTSLLALGACSDGGSSNNFRTGVLLDSPVTGISYTTGSTSGVTDNQGRFKYRNGETVTFTLGSLDLGSAPAGDTITLFDLAEVSTPPTDAQSLSEQLYPGNSFEPVPLQRALNTAMLLQSLDDDENPANGINITPQVAALVNSDEINLGLRYWEFRTGGNGKDGTGLPGLLRQAAAANALSARPVRHPALALEHMLGQQGITISVTVNTASMNDDDADGTPDRSRSMTWTASGKIASDEYDNDGDNASDTVYRYSYNSNLDLLSRDYDNDGDGNVDSTRVYEYDAFGSPTRALDTAGTTTTRDQRTTYDSDGKLIERETSTPTTRLVEFWIVDANGMRSTYEVDNDGDGNIDRRSLLEYGTQTRGDRWLVSNIDTDLDGSADSRTTRAFNTFGQLTSEIRDTDLDGNSDYIVSYVYDAIGNQIAFDRDIGGNGVDYSTRQERNARGFVTQVRYDQQGDGIFEFSYDYVYNAEDKITQFTYTRDNVVESIGTYTYDSNGNQDTYSYDAGGDSTIDRINRYTYNADGKRIRSEYDSNNDGTPEQISTWSNFIDVGLAAHF